MQFHYNTKVTDIRFEISAGKKIARQLHLLTIEGKQDIDLTEDDLVFLTPGGCVENSALGSQDSPAAYSTDLKEGAAGTCGAASPPRIRPSAIPTSSALTRRRPTG